MSPIGTVTGTVRWGEGAAPIAGAELHVLLEDVSRADVASILVAEQRLDPTPAAPIPFTLDYDARAIDSRNQYSVRASIRDGDALLFVTDRAYPVITRDNPSHVELVLVAADRSRAPRGEDLLGVRWVLRTLGAQEVTPPESARTPYLSLSTDDGAARAHRVSGHSGCNAFHGTARIDRGKIELGPLASTRMACAGPVMELESRFLQALGQTTRLRREGTRLVFLSPDGEVATFETEPETEPNVER